MKYFDAHSHLNFSQYNKDRDTVLDRMKVDGVATITVGTNVETSQEAIDLAGKHENIWASVGVHPTEVQESIDFSRIEELVTKPKVVAIGECGLDFFHTPYNEGEQKDLFLQHLFLAQKASLPLIIHCRNAYGVFLETLKEEDVTSLDGVMHFFAGTVDEAQAFLDIGMYISFAGPITFTDEYDTVIQTVPLERLLIETDAPFAAPTPYRGTRNEPVYVVEVAKKVAVVKKAPIEQIVEQTIINTKALFKI